MANQNDFVSFATGSGANTLSASAYQALTTLLADGFQTGVAQSVQINTALRQASSIAAMIAQFGATGGPMVDNGDVAALLTSFETALTKYPGFLQQLVPNASMTVTPTSILTQVTPAQSSGSITITLAAGSISGQRVRIAGSGIGSVIVNSSVSTGSPAFALTTGAYGYTTTIPASNQAFVDFTWDGVNWRMFPSYQYALLASPAFTGSPTAPTPAPASNNTQLATTAWTRGYAAALNGSSSEAFNVANAATSTEAVALGQLPSLTEGRLLDIKVFGASTTYTSTAGTNSVVIMAVGGGGAGAGASATNSSQQSAGSGGSAGAFAWGRYGGPLSGVSITIGAGAAGGTSLNGAAGGTTTVAGYLSCPGGPGGSNPGSNAPGGFGSFSGSSSAPTGYNILGYPGERGHAQATVSLTLTPTGGKGGSTIFGVGGAPGAVGTGNGAIAYGAGGGGASQGTSSGGASGGGGASGVVIIWEYA